jgi:hypothetical protein
MKAYRADLVEANAAGKILSGITILIVIVAAFFSLVLLF